MLARNRQILIAAGSLFLLAWIIIGISFYYQSREAVIEDARAQIQNALLYHRALHTYVEEVQKPEIYRLKDEGRLYRDYFAPEVLSFTFIARNVQRILSREREKLKLPEIRFKLAAVNARNPVNQADPFEAQLLKRFNEDEIDSYQSLIRTQGETYLYTALPIQPNKRSCMRCHSDPSVAPAEMVEMYGPERGFHEELGEIRALISIRISLHDAFAQLRRDNLLFDLLSALLMAAIFSVVAWFVRRLDREQRNVLESNRKLELLSITDPLTGLYNRNKFNLALDESIAAARRYGTPLGLVMTDIDHFKAINDRHGHLRGDQVLKAFADYLRSASRDSDLCARWGGEEFCLLLPHTDLDGAVRLAEHLLKGMGRVDFSGGISLTASFGVTAYAPGDQAMDLLGRVDQALYRAKQQGRNRVEALAPGSIQDE